MDEWLITTGPEGKPGINGGFMKRERPEEKTVLTLSVPSADEYVSRVKGAGGKIFVPKNTTPGIDSIVTCMDTEGNVFGILEEDSSA